MRRYLPLLASLLAVWLAGGPVAAQQDPAGVWTGQWERDGSTLAVEMIFSHDASGYEGSFSSSQLRVVGIPLTGIRYEAPAMSWRIIGDETMTAFEGALRGDTLSGVFHDGSASGTFALSRGTSTAAPVREEEVSFGNGPVTLSGTIVSPAGSGPFPGIVFLHGSGAEGRWASRYLAYEFAHRGIASLIYDKRGVGRSTGDWRTAGFVDLVHDGSSAVETLRSRPNIAPGMVGIYGHSQGGTIAPWLASENEHVAFVVAAAAGSGKMSEMEIYSLENDMNVRGLPTAEKQVAEHYVRSLVATAYDGAARAELDRVWEEVRGHPWALEPPPASDYWWAFSRRIAGYDSLDFWPRVTVPVLLLYGEEDERVPARSSAARIAQAYLGVKGSRLSVIFFPFADHNYRLRQDATGKFAWPRTAPGFPDRMIEWVLEVVKS